MNHSFRNWWEQVLQYLKPVIDVVLKVLLVIRLVFVIAAEVLRFLRLL